MTYLALKPFTLKMPIFNALENNYKMPSITNATLVIIIEALCITFWPKMEEHKTYPTSVKKLACILQLWY
jgi:hypothetical protein